MKIDYRLRCQKHLNAIKRAKLSIDGLIHDDDNCNECLDTVALTFGEHKGGCHCETCENYVSYLMDRVEREDIAKAQAEEKA